MYHGTIGVGLIKIQSQPDRNSGTLYIADGALIRNRLLSYRWCHIQHK